MSAARQVIEKELKELKSSQEAALKTRDEIRARKAEVETEFRQINDVASRLANDIAPLEKALAELVKAEEQAAAAESAANGE